MLVQVCVQSTYTRIGKFFLETASKKIISVSQATRSVSQSLNYAFMAKKQPTNE